jgi:putative membrane protein
VSESPQNRRDYAKDQSSEINPMQHDNDAHHVDVEAEEIFALTRPDHKLLILYIIYSVLANAAILFVFPPLFFRYITLRYRFDKEGVAVSYGILWRKETYLTYPRIQDIHVTRNIFERWLGIGTVQIQTASGSSTAVESIVGVTEYNEIRNFLYARMRGRKLKSKTEFSGAAPSPLDQLLHGIRDELRAIRLSIEDKRDV